MSLSSGSSYKIESEDDWSIGKSSTSKSTSVGKSSTDTPTEKVEVLASAETRAVFRLRLVVLFILFIAAAGVSTFVFLLTAKAEDDQFEAQFEGSATIVLEKFENILKENLAAISTVSVATIGYSIDFEGEWPFITLSFIQQRFAKTNQIAGSLYIGFNPMVEDGQKEAWEKFTNDPEARRWIEDGLEYQEQMNLNRFDEMTADDPLNVDLVGSLNMTYDTDDGGVASEFRSGPYLPVWQTSPVLRQGLVNKNRFHDPVFAKWANLTMVNQQVYFGGMKTAPRGFADSPNPDTQFYATILSYDRNERTEYLEDPVTDVYIPVFDSFGEDRKSVAILRAVFHWKSYFRKILPPNIPHMNVVLDNSCEGSYTYIMMGHLIEPVGPGDQHDTAYDEHEYSTTWDGLEDIGDGTVMGLSLNQDECQYSIRVFPTLDYYKEYHTGTPMIMTIAVAAIFVFTTCMFFFYDRLVERRQNLVMRQAKQSNAIVSSLFPKNVRDRLMKDEAEKKKTFMGPQTRLKNFLGGEMEAQDGDNRAIADLFPNCTVLFADIVGFTAWSSARDPTQVFDLLQTIYQAFDNVAHRRKVFKVETIGDCYVAVTGLPEPQQYHAMIMSKFAAECSMKLMEITKQLEVTLGPDTGDLGMRFGLHSGPVTAGVLRGDRSRFQLFGDTVNTAARMESTGARDKIQVSQATADLISAAGKDHWLEPRKDAVKAKGKGVMVTYWLHPHTKKSSDTENSSLTGDDHKIAKPIGLDDHSTILRDEDFLSKEGRRIDWICRLLEENIKKVVARREATRRGGNRVPPAFDQLAAKIPLDEVEDKIKLTNLDMQVAMKESNFNKVRLDPDVKSQLREYVSEIASMYHRNPFHNFEHACHVTMSVVKLLKRIVSPDLDVDNLKTNELVSQLHDYTYGITSDPMATLAIIFSALIHDVDHRGVGNNQLMKEEPEMSDNYRGKSIAEQNSLDIAWDILMRRKYRALRGCIFGDNEDFVHFRQVAVNVVLATDIFDKELNSARKDRWVRAFSNDVGHADDDIDLKATIVIEHIIQASDVAHTMQHWHIYQRWNERLFRELTIAYRAGRMGADPATFWYQGEIGFFDNYIIPLAKKLKECGVFGVSSDEYLNYAILNRDEWKEKGESIVKQFIERLQEDDLEE